VDRKRTALTVFTLIFFLCVLTLGGIFLLSRTSNAEEPHTEIQNPK
jgi:hypothetical protein